MFRKFAGTMAGHYLGSDFLLDKLAGPVARGAFVISKKVFDTVIIQRGHVRSLWEWRDSLAAA
jgi:hypothetical protein